MDESYLLVGLGNPGREYQPTRHNIGFRIADAAALALGVRFSRQQSRAFVAAGVHAGRKVILAKPQTFMNLSGASVSELLRFYKIPLERLLVACDDIDLPFGALRIRASGGSAGQRGMQSILDSLGTKDVPRLRFGIGRPPGRMDAADYVLHDFDPQEEEALPLLVETAARAALTFVELSLTDAMNRYNVTPDGGKDPR